MSKKKTGTRNMNGMGNVYKTKAGRYEYRKMVDGELRVVTAKTPAELSERVKALSGMPMSKEKVKIYDWVEKWLSVYIKPLKKASTHKQYDDTWKCYIKPNIKNIYTRSIKPIDIQNIIAKMHEKGLSASTMKQVRKVLNLVFKKALSEKLIAENPVKGVEIPDVQQKARKTLKVEELQKIFDYLQKSRWYWPLRFMLVTGVRRGELLALKWSDIDERERIITISDNNTDQGIGTTKSNKVHYVALSDMAVKCLNEFKKQLQKENNPAVFKNETDIIFVSRKGGPLKPHSLNNVFRRIEDNTDVDVSPHSMRHTFVYYSKNKLSLAELKDNLGHDVSTSTLDIYGVMLFDAKDVAKKLDQVFDGMVSEDKPLAKAVNNVVDFNDFKKQK